MTHEKWIISEYEGPFCSIVSESGAVIAMRIIDRKYAEMIVNLREENAMLSMAVMGKEPNIFDKLTRADALAEAAITDEMAKKRINELNQEINLIETLLDIIEERGQIIDNLAREVEELKKPRLI